MAFLVNDVFVEVRELFPAFYPTGTDTDATAATNAKALAILNKAQVDLMRMVDLYPYEDVAIPVVYGQREYAMSPSIVRINAAQYVQAPGSSIPLRETSIDRMDTEYRGWRTFSQVGQPYLYYTQGGRLGLYQAPNQTSSLGYPNVTLNVLTRHDFTSVNDPLPAQIDKPDAYVMATCVHWCLRNDLEKLPVFAPMADNAAKDLQSFVRRIQVRQKDRIRSDIPYPTNL